LAVGELFKLLDLCAELVIDEGAVGATADSAVAGWANRRHPVRCIEAAI